MKESSAFDIKTVEEQAYSQPSGLLDQLNLPPGAIRFIRENQKVIQVICGVVIVAIVAGSLYKSYRSQRLENAASSLSLALDAEGAAKVQELTKVAEEFSGTPSSLWATTELGHQAMKDTLYTEAVAYYTQVRDKISTTNPMYGLLSYGIAQANEAAKNYDAAATAYSSLKGISGYEDDGFRGMARVLEAQGKNDKALAIYEEYMGTFFGEDQNEQLKKLVMEKITRLRVQ